MPHFAFISHLEPLFPAYNFGEADAYVYFSLNFSAAMVESAAEADVPSLLPWNWSFKDLAVWTAKGDKLQQSVTVQKVLPTLISGAKYAQLLDAIKAVEFAAGGAFDASRYLWNQDLSKPVDTATLKKRLWHVVLGQMSTLPAPLPQSLNLTMVIRAKATDIPTDATEIFAAPVFADAHPFAGDRTPNPPNTTLSLNDTNNPLHRVDLGSSNSGAFFYSWDYGGNTPLVKLYQKQCSLAKPDVKASFIDLTTYWVKKPDGSTAPDTRAEDWSASLRIRSAEAFDLPQRLIEIVRTGLSYADFDASRKDLWKAVIASTRDLASPGVRVGPDGASLAVDLCAAVKLPVQDVTTTLLTLDAAGTEAFKTAASWATFLSATAFPSEFFLKDPDAQGSPNPVLTVSQQDAAEGLQRIVQELSEPATLQSVVFGQWDLALKQKAYWTDTAQQQVRLRLQDFNLHQRLAMANLTPVWQSFQPGLHDPDQLRDQLKAALEDYYQSRFHLKAGTTFPDYSPHENNVTSSIKAAIIGKLDSFIDDFMQKLIVQEDQPANMPDSVSVQVDQLDPIPGDTGGAGDQADFLRRIAGIGVMMKTDYAGWEFLDLVNARVCGSDGQFADDSLQDYKGQDIVATALLAPSRLKYSEGLRQTFITYDGHPLSAESPAKGFAQVQNLIDDHPNSGDLDLPGWLRYGSPYSPSRKLPGLWFGMNGLLVPFVIGTAGVLAPGVADPTLVAPLSLATFDPNATKAVPRPFTYKRRVGIGPLRANTDTGVPLVPRIPDSVVPLARSLTKPTADGDLPLEQTPVLLLVPDQENWSPSPPRMPTSHTFNVRPPSAQLITWDRWLGPSNQPLRASVWADFHAITDNSKTDDATIDDPAVACFYARLTPVYPAGASTTNPVPIPLPGPKVKSGIAQVQSQPLTVTCRAGALKISLSQSGLEAAVPEGSVYRLEIFSAVKVSDKVKFADAIWTLAEQVTVATGPLAGDYRIFSPRSFLVEVATGSMPSALEIANSLQLPSVSNSVVAAMSAPASFKDFCGRVELMVQQWHWDGRALPDFAPDMFIRPSNLELGWDPVGFGGRASSDHLVIPGRVDFTASADNVTLMNHDLTPRPQCLYYRFALRAFSRYHDLMTAGQPVDSRTAGTETDRWERLVIPSRWNKQVPPPAVKLIVPLTEGDDLRSPGLLVVMSEPWFGIGGLAETFEVELMHQAPPEGGAPIAEFGPDAIFSYDPETSDPLLPSPRGPFGFTFDQNAAAPNWAASAFILDPPSASEGKFIRLRFRRALSRKLQLDGPPTDAVSSFTHPVWAQFIASASLFDVTDPTTQAILRVSVKNMNLQYDAGTNELFLSSGGRGVVLTEHPRRAIYLVLTRRLVDFLGRQDQQSFLQFVKQKATGALDVTGDPSQLAHAGLQASILEVHHYDGKAPLPDDLKLKIVEDQTEQDAEIRLLRFSRPIEFVGMEGGA